MCVSAQRSCSRHIDERRLDVLVLLLAVDRCEVAAPLSSGVLVALPVHLLAVEIVLGGLASQQLCGDRVAHDEPLLLDQPQRGARGRRLGQREKRLR